MGPRHCPLTAWIGISWGRREDIEVPCTGNRGPGYLCVLSFFLLSVFPGSCRVKPELPQVFGQMGMSARLEC